MPNFKIGNPRVGPGLKSVSHMAHVAGSLNAKWSRLPTFRNWHMARPHPDCWLLLRHGAIWPHKLLSLQATVGAGEGAFALWVARAPAGPGLCLTEFANPGPGVRVARFWVISPFSLN